MIWTYGDGFSNKGYEEIFKNYKYDKNSDSDGNFVYLSSRYTYLDELGADFGICNLDFKSDSECVAGRAMCSSYGSVWYGNGKLVPVVSINLKKANCSLKKIEEKGEFQISFK